MIDAVVACAERGIYGYTNCPQNLTALTLDRLRDVYGCVEPKPEWFSWQPGLVPGLSHAVRIAVRSAAAAQRAPDTDATRVAVLTPAYPPFLAMPPFGGALLEAVPLRQEHTACGSGAAVLRYEIDWALLERSLAQASTRLFLFCNPHNPTGRCWTRDDVRRVASLCATHDVLLCSDEVWGEMPLEAPTTPFTSALALLEEVEGLRERLIVLTSPSKCFNVATLDIALAVVPDPALQSAFVAAGRDQAEVGASPTKRGERTGPLPSRAPHALTTPPSDLPYSSNAARVHARTRAHSATHALARSAHRRGSHPSPSLHPSHHRGSHRPCSQVTPFGFFAAEAAFGPAESEAWRQRLITYVRANRDYAIARLGAVPGMVTTRPESSYLLWVDASAALPPGAKSAADHLLSHGVGVSEGVDFAGAPGCFRINLACLRTTLERGLGRVVDAFPAPPSGP